MRTLICYDKYYPHSRWRIILWLYLKIKSNALSNSWAPQGPGGLKNSRARLMGGGGDIQGPDSDHQWWHDSWLAVSLSIYPDQCNLSHSRVITLTQWHIRHVGGLRSKQRNKYNKLKHPRVLEDEPSSLSFLVVIYLDSYHHSFKVNSESNDTLSECYKDIKNLP